MAVALEAAGSSLQEMLLDADFPHFGEIRILRDAAQETIAKKFFNTDELTGDNKWWWQPHSCCPVILFDAFLF